MRKALALAFGLVCSLTAFAQGGEMTFDGEKAAYEILADRRIGPGTKYTEYYFNDIGSRHYTMRVLVVEIDNDNEYTYQSPFMATYDDNEKYHQSTTKIQEFRWQEDHVTQTKRRPLATVMSGGFVQDQQHETSVQMEVTGGLVCNGIMHYMPDSGAEHYYVDGDGNVKIGILKCSPTVSSANAGEHAINVFNRLRSNKPTGVTLFANGYGMKDKFKTADIQSAKDKGTEVVVTLDNADGIICSGVYKGKVTKIMSGSFNKFEKGQVVLASVEGEGEEWLKKLTEGEQITINMQYYDADGVPVKLQSSVRIFWGYAVKAGAAQPNNNQGYAQDALGLSADGKKSFYFHLDNIADSPAGLPSTASISHFNQFIQQIPGVYDAILMDGGPSAEMVVKGEWVSQNNGRYIPASVMVYSKAPNRPLADEADFADYSKKLYIDGGYTPEFYFFNKYGEVVSSPRTTAITLSCEPEDLGAFSEDGKTFIPKKGGKGYLCATCNNRTDKMYIEIADAKGLKVVPDKLVDVESGQVINVTLYKIGVDDTETLLDNSEAKWSTNNPSTVYSCENGNIVLAFPGDAEVYVDYLGMRATITVHVVTGIKDIESTAPVRVSVDGSVVNVAADDASVRTMSCQMYTADGKLVGSASAEGSNLKVTRGASAPVIILLTIDGKKYIYKLI